MAGFRHFYAEVRVEVKVESRPTEPIRMRSLLPSALRAELARRRLRLPEAFPRDVRVRLARSKDDFRAVHALLGGGLTKYHALPSTTTLVLTRREEIVATASLVRAGSFGSPVDGSSDIEFLKESGARLVTLTSLAFASGADELRLPFFKGIFDYCSESFGCEVLSVLAKDARDLDFYESILLFEPMPGHPHGRLAVLRMARRRELFASIYGKRAPAENLSRFFDLRTENVELPVRDVAKLSDPVLTPELMNELFREKTDVFARLTEFEKQVLFDLYDSEDYRSVLPAPDRESRSLVRKDKRFEVESASRVFVPGRGPVNGSLRNVSAKGLLFDSERALREGERYVFQLSLGESRSAIVEGVVLRNEVKRRYGIRIVEASGEWHQLIKYLERDLRVATQP